MAEIDYAWHKMMEREIERKAQAAQEEKEFSKMAEREI